MARTPASSTYAKQSRIAARGGLRLFLLLAAVGLVCLVVSGFQWYVKLLLGIAVFCLLVTALELGNASYAERKDQTSRMPLQRELVPNTDFEYISTKDEGAWFERRIVIDGIPYASRFLPGCSKQ